MEETSFHDHSEEINLIDAVGRRWPTRVYSAIMPCSGNGPHTRNDTAPGGSWLFVRGDCVQHVQNQQRSTHYPSIHSVSQFPFSHKSQDLHVSILWSVKSHFSIFWLVRFPTNYSIYRYVYYIYKSLYTKQISVYMCVYRISYVMCIYIYIYPTTFRDSHYFCPISCCFLLSTRLQPRNCRPKPHKRRPRPSGGPRLQRLSGMAMSWGT